MKTVLLLRHAKSSWDPPRVPDVQRPLAPRGRKAAARMGAYMARQGLLPDHILCSSARRAVETWELVIQALDRDVPTDIAESLYGASPTQVLTLLRHRTARENAILVIGHNPTFEELALGLAGSGDPEALDKLRHKYPTAALAILDFPVRSWDEIEHGSACLRGFVRPRELA